jgi:chromosome segregation ATPase
MENMEKDLLTIKDFAQLAGVSVQSIYKKIGKQNNPIQRYLVELNGLKYIRRAALDVLYSPAPAVAASAAEVEEQPPQTDEPAKTKSSTDRLLDILEQQLEDQRRQLAEKDKQIADQSRQISQLLEQLAENAKIINQQQQLTAMNTQFLLGQPAAATGEEVEPPAEEAAPAQEQNAAAAAPAEITPDTPQKLGFFQRIFGKGKK